MSDIEREIEDDRSARKSRLWKATVDSVLSNVGKQLLFEAFIHQ